MVKYYYCNICDKNYSSYQSYWYHNKKFHKQKANEELQNTNEIITNPSNNDIHSNNDIEPNIILNTENQASKTHNTEIQTNIIDNKKLYKCKFCNKLFKYRENKYEHQKKVCEKKINNQISEEDFLRILDNITITPKIKEKMNNKIQIINEVPNIINNNITNNIINNITNNIVINKIGNEDILELTKEENEEILNNINNSINKIIDIINFNERLPGNHSFCSTDLNSKYLSVYDGHTNTINKHNKMHIFRNLIDTSIIKIQHIFQYDTKLSNTKRRLIQNQINEYLNIKNMIINDKYKKIIYTNLNLTSYNKKHIVLNTWNKLQKNIIIAESFNDNLNQFIMDENKDILYGINPI